MDVPEFRLLLDALGPDLADWPEPVADAAVELMAGSPAAQDLFAATAERQEAGAPSQAATDLIARILAEVGKPGA